LERSDPITIGQALRRAAERLAAVADRPFAEAERLLAHRLRVERTTLLAHPERYLSDAEADTYTALVAKRASGFPLPYLLGTIEFYGFTFEVTPDVLIPRPETELLVDLALGKLRDWHYPRVVDVGTGSGCIAVTLAAKAPAMKVCATDISMAALRVAQANGRRLGVADRLTWLQADVLSALAPSSLDLIVSNPPYVSTPEWEELPTSVREEPRLALLAGGEGLDVIERLLAQAARRLSPRGCLLVEIGEVQGQAARSLAETAFNAARRGVEIRLHRDLAGKDRVLEVSLSGPANEPALK
jgi:release factor glutamine methyltransferase